MMDNNKPLVSINCITFNHEKYIKEALDSFLMQKTNFEYEILIHDDASTDNTADIIRKYEKKYPDIIKPIYQQENQYSKNGNISKNFQYPRAKGNYIAICEGDDYWTDPNKLQKQVDFLESNPDYGFVHCNFDKLYNKTGRIRKSANKINTKKFATQDQIFIGILLNTYSIGTLTVMARKDLLIESFDSIDLSTHLMGDLPTWLEISQKTKFHYIQDSVGVYRKVSGSASNTESTYHQFIDSGLRIRLEFAKRYSVSNRIVEILEKSYYKNLFVLAFRSKDKSLSEKCINEMREKKYSINSFFKLIHYSIDKRPIYWMLQIFDSTQRYLVNFLKYILRLNVK